MRGPPERAWHRASPHPCHALHVCEATKGNYSLQLQVCSDDRKKNRAAAGAAGAAAMRSRATCAALPFQLYVRATATVAVSALSWHDAQPPPSPPLSRSSPVSFSASSIHRRHRHCRRRHDHLTPHASASQFTPPVRRETREPGQYLQLQEIRLYDHAGELLDIKALENGGMATIAAPNGSSPYPQGLENLFDGDVSECLCSYGEYDSSGTLPAMHCHACADFTKGSKWLEYNTAEPCETSTDNRGR